LDHPIYSVTYVLCVLSGVSAEVHRHPDCVLAAGVVCTARHRDIVKRTESGCSATRTHPGSPLCTATHVRVGYRGCEGYVTVADAVELLAQFAADGFGVTVRNVYRVLDSTLGAQNEGSVGQCGCVGRVLGSRPELGVLCFGFDNVYRRAAVLLGRDRGVFLYRFDHLVLGPVGREDEAEVLLRLTLLSRRLHRHHLAGVGDFTESYTLSERRRVHLSLGPEFFEPLIVALRPVVVRVVLHVPLYRGIDELFSRRVFDYPSVYLHQEVGLRGNVLDGFTRSRTPPMQTPRECDECYYTQYRSFASHGVLLPLRVLYNFPYRKDTCLTVW